MVRLSFRLKLGGPCSNELKVGQALGSAYFIREFVGHIKRGLAVTKAHHKASCALLILEFSPVSQFKIPIAPKVIRRKVKSDTDKKVPCARFLKINTVNCFNDLIPLNSLNILMTRAILPHLAACRNGILEIKSIHPHFRNWIFDSEYISLTKKSIRKYMQTALSIINNK